jgi:CRISPR-associated RAMP protein (TIGR02581 family)
MLKQLINECIIDMHLHVDGALLIKSGLAQPSGVDMAWVQVFRNGREEVYLPGSSLKGVLRSHAERIARTLNPVAACDPFGQKDDPAGRSCSLCFEKIKDERKERKEKEPNSIESYRDACLICKLFGSTWFVGRLATADAYAVGETPTPSRRDGVGIDRFSGGSSHGAKFELEVITKGKFKTTLHLRNFELWQLGLVGFVLQDLKDGLIRIGSGKSRGLGKVHGEVQSVAIHYLGLKESPQQNGHLLLSGTGQLMGEEMAEAYDMKESWQESSGAIHKGVAPIPYSGKITSNGLRTSAVFDKDTFPWHEFGPFWVNRVRNFEDKLKDHRRGGEK